MSNSPSLCFSCGIKPRVCGSYCYDCKRSNQGSDYKRHRSERLSKVRVRTKKNIVKLDALKIGPCMDCGVVFIPSLLDFDHREAESKIANVSRLISHSWEAIQEEIAKCDLVCANCHRVRTYIRKYGTLEPTPSKNVKKTPSFMRNWTQLLIIKSKPCTDCGKTFHFYSMELDHRDPINKVDEPSNMVRRAEADFKLEMAKCDLVCSNCHRLRTAKLQDWGKAAPVAVPRTDKATHKLSEEDQRKIRELRSQDLSLSKIARLFSVTKQTIWYTLDEAGRRNV